MLFMETQPPLMIANKISIADILFTKGQQQLFDRRRGVASLIVGASATVVELEDFEGHLMASPSELRLKRLECENAAAKRSDSKERKINLILS